MQKGSFWVVKGVLLVSKRSPFRVQKESFLENKEILSGKQCNLECFSIWIEPQIVGGYGVLLYAFQYSQFNLIVRYYHPFSTLSLIPLRSNPFKYKQMLILFINPLLLRLYIRKPKE